MSRRAAIAGVLLLLAAVMPATAQELNNTALDSGYRDLYNLQFDEAHQHFADWQKQHPDDPMGPASDAAAYLFSEFNRMHILEIDFFADDSNFTGDKNKPVPDPVVRQHFDAALARAQQLAHARLAHDPNDANALLAEVLTFGLRGDYLALVEKRNFAGLSQMKQGRALAQRLLATDPHCYDAYVAVGVENYLLSQKPAPVRWFLRLGGAQTDEDVGLQDLRLTAEKGHLLRPFARLLLAVAAVRAKDRKTARSLLLGLSQNFPQNTLYAKELARLQ